MLVIFTPVALTSAIPSSTLTVPSSVGFSQVPAAVTLALSCPANVVLARLRKTLSRPRSVGLASRFH